MMQHNSSNNNVVKPDRISVKESFASYPYRFTPKDKRHLEQEDYNIIYKIGNEVLYTMLLEGVHVELPARMGELGVVKYRPKVKPINWDVYNREGIMVRHSNFHSDGMTSRVRWSKVKCNWENHKTWAFKLLQHKSKEMGRYFKDNGMDHITKT